MIYISNYIIFKYFLKIGQECPSTFNLLKLSLDCFSSKTIVWLDLRRYFPGNFCDSRANKPGASIKRPCLTLKRSGFSEKYTPLLLAVRPRMFSTYSEKSASLSNDDWLTNITTAHLDASFDPIKINLNKSSGPFPF